MGCRPGRGSPCGTVTTTPLSWYSRGPGSRRTYQAVQQIRCLSESPEARKAHASANILVQTSGRQLSGPLDCSSPSSSSTIISSTCSSFSPFSNVRLLLWPETKNKVGFDIPKTLCKHRLHFLFQRRTLRKLLHTARRSPLKTKLSFFFQAQKSSTDQ